MGVPYYLWITLQILVGYNLVFPFFLYVVWKIVPKTKSSNSNNAQLDYGIIVTAYEQIHTLPAVVASILKLNYENYLVYIVADKCDITTLVFNDPRVIVLRPPLTLASNTKSHKYALENFKRNHDCITIIDSDNLVDKDYLTELNMVFSKGYSAVQGVREAKNLNTTYACLDAARDIYYHFYDGKLLFEVGSSATLAGSGMGFKTKLYEEFLEENQVSGAGFDKVLQAWLLKKQYQIAFCETAVVFDEKTTMSAQLVQQRSRWINTWFKYFSFGFKIFGLGLKNLNWNQLLFGVVLLRPPLFLFLIASMILLFINVVTFNFFAVFVWGLSFFLFVFFFLFSLSRYKTDPRIYKSLINIPNFIFFQILSLLKARKANKISVATKHSYNKDNP
ncbi:MAG: glycosyltransferase [Bacteroidota bacterium]